MRTLAALIVVCLAAALAVPDARAASLVVEARSGLVLHADEATRPWYPASLTKMMTGYLTFQAIAEGQIKRTTKLKVSADAAGQPPSKLGLKVGAVITVEEAVTAMAVRSANDAAVVLAEALAESEEGFAVMMTAQARALGMRATVFRNASGLPDPGQRTTARDMAILAGALLRDHPEAYAVFSRKSAGFRGRGYRSNNRWASGYEGADGIKTGFTCASGYNLAASALRGGRRLITVVLGAKTSALRNVLVTKLMDRGFEALAAPTAAGRNGRVLLGDLAPAPAGTAPPSVISAKACASQVAAVPKEAPLSGWGITFGSFRQKAAARKLARERQQALKPVIKRGRIAVVPRQREGFLGYSALIVGLEADDAGRACKHLWSQSAYCLALAPKVLQNPNALWR